MSKLKDLVQKGVRLIVTEAESVPPKSAQDREIPPEAFDLSPPPPEARSEVPADVADFAAVYEERAIQVPAHGYGVDKVAEMLASKRLSTLGREVKATAVMAALEAAQAPIREVIQDAVQRDQALDAFEAAKERELKDLREQSAARKKTVQEEIEGFLREKNTELEELKKAEDAATEAFVQLQARKRREEERLHDVVAHFVEGENPITTGQKAPAPPPPPTPASDPA
jgi:regulator of extracellular matrix RemA (YlzA/DUF370 family)